MKNPFARPSLASLGLAALLTLPGAAHAVDFHVTTAQELQNALTLAAANGADDTISLAAGYYTGNFNFNSTENRSLVLQGEPGTTNTDITIDGAGGGRSMNLSSSATANSLTVRGLTFLRNCGSSANAGLRIAGGTICVILVDACRFISPTNTSGMGLELVSGLNATVSGCSVVGVVGGSGVGISISGVSGNVGVQDCLVDTNALGLYINASSIATLTRSTFSGNGNYTDNSGYNYSAAGAVCNGTTVTLAGNTFTGNYGRLNGGAYCSGTTLTLTGNTFSGNSATGNLWNDPTGSSGGAECSGTTIILTGNTFTRNYADAWGGACCIGPATLTSNTFTGNSSGGGWRGTTGGGGAYCSEAATLTGNTFTGNYANGAGGGAWCVGPAALTGNTFTDNGCRTSGGGIYCPSTLTVSSNSFTGNSAGGAGGGAYFSGSGTLTLSDNWFKSNRAATGAGLCVDGATARLLNSLFVNNSQSSSSSKGGGLWVQAAALDMINNTVTANTAAGSGGGVAIQVGGVTEVLRVYNNIIWGNSADGNGADVHLAGTGSRKEFLFNDAHGMYGVWDLALNNLDVAPAFFDPVNGDYHLRSTSPCLNAGTNGAPSIPPLDLDGNVRTNGVAVDLGCYEFNNTVFHPADANQNWVITPAEYAAYAAAWKNSQPWPVAPAQIPADYVTRAGLLQNQGGSYHNDGAGAPLCWKPGTN